VSVVKATSVDKLVVPIVVKVAAAEVASAGVAEVVDEVVVRTEVPAEAEAQQEESSGEEEGMAVQMEAKMSSWTKTLMREQRGSQKKRLLSSLGRGGFNMYVAIIRLYDIFHAFNAVFYIHI
jgi:hypothetical protein